jgi:hypothetical protein
MNAVLVLRDETIGALRMLLDWGRITAQFDQARVPNVGGTLSASDIRSISVYVSVALCAGSRSVHYEALREAAWDWHNQIAALGWDPANAVEGSLSLYCWNAVHGEPSASIDGEAGSR